MPDSFTPTQTAPTGTQKTNEVATKYDSGRPAYDLLPTGALEEVAYVLGYGRDKYGAYNWAKGFAWSRLARAAIGHIFQWMRRDPADKETGRSHLAHAVATLLFLLEHEQRSLGSDDREVR